MYTALISFQFLESTTQQNTEILMILTEHKLATLGRYFPHRKKSGCRCCQQWFQNQVCLTQPTPLKFPSVFPSQSQDDCLLSHTHLMSPGHPKLQGKLGLERSKVQERRNRNEYQVINTNSRKSTRSIAKGLRNKAVSILLKTQR